MDNQDQSAIPVGQPQSSVSQPVIPPVGSAHKEYAPASLDARQGGPVSTHEIMQPTEAEPQLHPEVTEAGVAVVKDAPDLTNIHKQVGIELAKEAVVHPTAPTGMVQMAMTEGEAKEAIKHKNPQSSLYFMALAVFRQFQKMHQKITG